MSSKLPAEIRKFSRVLMAGEDIVLVEQPSIARLAFYELVVLAGAFVVVFLLMSLFSGLPMGTKAAASLVFSLAGLAIVHFSVATTTYMITSQRVLLLNNLNAELKDSCDISEITGVRLVGFAHQLIIERANGTPLRLFGLKNRNDVQKVIIEAE